MKANDISKREELVDGLGTHYVSKISYGGQMVASIKLEFSPNSSRYVKFTLSLYRIIIHIKILFRNGNNAWSVDCQ